MTTYNLFINGELTKFFIYHLMIKCNLCQISLKLYVVGFLLFCSVESD